MNLSRIGLVLGTLAAVGCIQGQRVVKVNPDGSGTVVDTVKLTEEAAEMKAGFESMGEGETPSSPEEKKAKEDAQYRELAGQMGLEFVSRQATPDGGERMTYSFKDANALRIGIFPTMSNEKEPGKDAVGIRFEKKGGTSVLTVAPSKESLDGSEPKAAAADAPKPSAEELAQEIRMMKGMMAGLKVDLVFEVNGTLLKSSSPHTRGKAVTILGIDFEKIDQATLELMAGDKQPDFTKASGAKGITVAGGPVTIEFK